MIAYSPPLSSLASFYHRCQRSFSGRLVGKSPLLMHFQVQRYKNKVKQYFFSFLLDLCLIFTHPKGSNRHAGVYDKGYLL